MEASEEVTMVNKGDDGKSGIRYYTTIEELSRAINAGLSLQDRRMSEEEAMEAAEHIINFFGYNDRVIDNMLEPEDRDSFYTMEDIGILQTEREETTLFDGREWRIHYWILNINKIMELANMQVDYKKKITNDEYKIYDEIPDDYWKVVE
ncbi:hypothetical protein [Thermoplasma acidophilum]|uniref:Uncharacterized protein n=2 Tax=Thermoplasma acidophilum TaxID=2303 RepID=Q7LWF8_THEAC|nr:DUF6015 family protein [Thermoplasma acidophilum]AAC44622.1 unknown [Thermoplasma acidophilum]MCY0851994.1 hypothetical protein [Thermoplasma acidophilum]CAC12609.1 hypothetical protein [Thermoplasma acidophilum]